MAALVVVGASWGGLRALSCLLPALPADFPAPIVLAQHRSPSAPDGLADALARRSPLPVSEPDDKDPIGTTGHVHVAPADYHLLVARDRFELSVDERVQHARPSIDVLFESAAEAYGREVVGVLLTGANEDGTAGLRRIRDEGGLTLVQDPATAERPRMPEAAIQAGAADRVLSLEAIARALVHVCAERREHRRGAA